MDITMILGLLSALLGGGILGTVQWYFNRKDNKDEFKENVVERLTKVEGLGKEMVDMMKKQKELNISEGRAMLDKYNHKFREMGYIPDDKYTIYKSLGEAYVNAGGNSDVKLMFLRNIEKLEVKED